MPCGEIINGGSVWCDLNGDGLQTSNEVTTAATNPGGFGNFDVDKNGNLWACLETASNNPPAVIREFICKGMTAQGVPIYDCNAGDYVDANFPNPNLPGGPFSSWGQSARLIYDSVNDVMYLLGPAVNRNPDGLEQLHLVCGAL